MKFHEERINCIKKIPNTDYFITGSERGRVTVIDAYSEKEIWSKKKHQCPISSISIHPDGSIIYVGEKSGYGVLWDIRCPRVISDFYSSNKDVSEGNLCFSSSEMKDKHYKKINTSQFSYDGLFVCTGAEDNTIRVWDIRKQNCAKILPAHLQSVLSVSFLSPQIGDLSGLLENLFDSTDDTYDKVSDNHQESGVILSHPNNYMISGDEMGEIKIWDWTKSQILFEQSLTDQEKIADLSFSKDMKTVLVGCLNKKMMLYSD